MSNGKLNKRREITGVVFLAVAVFAERLLLSAQRVYRLVGEFFSHAGKRTDWTGRLRVAGAFCLRFI